jgi:hypothetical protein
MVLQAGCLVFGIFNHTVPVKTKNKRSEMYSIMHCGGNKGQLHEMVLF